MADFITPDRSHLVAEYLLNGDARDTSGNGYHGSAVDVQWKKTDRGYQTYAGEFNGSSSEEFVTTAPLLNVSSAYTFNVVLNMSALPSPGNLYSILNKRETVNSAGYELELWNDGGVQKIFVSHANTDSGNSDTYSINYALPTLRTFLLTVTYDGSTVTFLVDNNVIGTVSGATRQPNPTNFGVFRLGRNAYSGARWYYGKMQSVRIFDVALSETERRNWYLESLRQLGGASYGELTANLRAYIDLKGDCNEIISGADGTNVGGSYIDDGMGGKKGLALDVNSYVVLPDLAPLNRSQDFTVILNFKVPLTNHPDTNCAWSIGYGSMYVNVTGYVGVEHYPAGGVYIQNPTPIFSPGDVLQVAFSMSRTSGSKLYINGVLQANDPSATGDISVIGGNLRLGTRVWGAPSQYGLNSEIYDFWEFDKALPDATIAQWNHLFRHPTSFLPFE